MNEIFEYIQNIVHEERINKSALKNINFNNLTFSDFSQKIFDQSFDKLSFKIKLAVLLNWKGLLAVHQASILHKKDFVSVQEHDFFVFSVLSEVMQENDFSVLFQTYFA
jgi:hypothetical protein